MARLLRQKQGSIDELEDGFSIRLLDTIDFNREVLNIEVDFSLPPQRVIRILEQIMQLRDKQQVIRHDNGPEYINATPKTREAPKASDWNVSS